MAAKTTQSDVRSAERHPILLFDGVCNFCNGAVAFVIKRDPEARFRFAALQSEVGQQLLARYGLQQDELDTVVVIHKGRAYTKSDAALQVARHLPGPWFWLYILRFVPRPLRNLLYDRFAGSRYALFGRQNECLIPAPAIRARFLGAEQGGPHARSGSDDPTEPD